MNAPYQNCAGLYQIRTRTVQSTITLLGKKVYGIQIATLASLNTQVNGSNLANRVL